ncbi:MAG: hypothetical protein JWM90_2790 [Thermoleophilia bacterium]|nr:hypothetical protein [Thermoleophilia bacterium]
MVQGTQSVGTRRRRKAAPAAAPTHAQAQAPQMLALRAKVTAATVKLPATLELGQFSKVEGGWRPDFEKAREYARKILATIDFSKRDIVLWVPGTDALGVHPDFTRAMKYLYQGGDVSLTAVDYEPTWSLRDSMPTGLATMKYVLDGIRQILAARGDTAQHRVLLGGLSQGAWVIGEAVADPKVGKIVSRAALIGHPWLAHHQYDEGQDPRVGVINHRGDQIAMPINGDAGEGMDTMTAVRTGKLKENLGLAAKVILKNPLHGVLLLQNMLHGVQAVRPFTRDPHQYDMEMPRLVNFLRTGVMDKSNEELDEEKRIKEQAQKAANQA